MTAGRLPVALGLLVLTACAGSSRPEKIIGSAGDTVIVSSQRTARIPARVVDERGTISASSEIRFKRIAGSAIPVSFSGLVRCSEPGAATVRASVGVIHRDLVLLCHPVRELRVAADVELIAGDSAIALPVQALGVDGRPLAVFGGTARTHDTSVASVAGLSIRPRGPGTTFVDVAVGDFAKSVFVTVYRTAGSLDNLENGQPVAVPIELQRGDTRRWKVPPGAYVLSVLESAGHERPKLAVQGANCSRLGFRTDGLICRAPEGASVIAYHPWDAAERSQAVGRLAVRPIEMR